MLLNRLWCCCTCLCFFYCRQSFHAVPPPAVSWVHLNGRPKIKNSLCAQTRNVPGFSLDGKKKHHRVHNDQKRRMHRFMFYFTQISEISLKLYSICSHTSISANYAKGIIETVWTALFATFPVILTRAWRSLYFMAWPFKLCILLQGFI